MDYNSKEMIHIKKENVEYLKFRLLERYSDKINHAITLRHGGVSTGVCKSLNFRSVGKDKRENNLKNLDIICKCMEIKEDNVYKASQAHTDNILFLNNENKNAYKYDRFNDEEYDGYITDEKNIASLITTADCNPIIIYDYNKNVVANVHSGWKGTIKQIYLKAIDKMINEFSCNVENMIFCIGPSIRKCCFVSKEKEFKDSFTNIWKDEENYIEFDNLTKEYHIDLTYVIKKDILNVGIKEENIAICDICTKCNSEDFFSYRDTLKKGLDDFGTFATIVSL